MVARCAALISCWLDIESWGLKEVEILVLVGGCPRIAIWIGLVWFLSREHNKGDVRWQCEDQEDCGVHTLWRKMKKHDFLVQKCFV